MSSIGGVQQHMVRAQHGAAKLRPSAAKPPDGAARFGNSEAGNGKSEQGIGAALRCAVKARHGSAVCMHGLEIRSSAMALLRIANRSKAKALRSPASAIRGASMHRLCGAMWGNGTVSHSPAQAKLVKAKLGTGKASQRIALRRQSLVLLRSVPAKHGDSLPCDGVAPPRDAKQRHKSGETQNLTGPFPTAIFTGNRVLHAGNRVLHSAAPVLLTGTTILHAGPPSVLSGLAPPPQKAYLSTMKRRRFPRNTYYRDQQIGHYICGILFAAAALYCLSKYLFTP